MIHAHIHHAHGKTELTLRRAFSLPQRLRGLLGQPELPPAHGLWIRPCNSVHSFFMCVAIDVLYLDAEQRIITIRPHLKPWRMSACFGARSVIELPAGECLRLGIQPGDTLTCAAP